MDIILLRITSVSIMVTSSTRISADIIRINLAWPIKQLNPSRILRPWNIMVTQQDLILRNIIKGLRKPLLIWQTIERLTILINIKRF